MCLLRCQDLLRWKGMDLNFLSHFDWSWMWSKVLGSRDQPLSPNAAEVEESIHGIGESFLEQLVVMKPILIDLRQVNPLDHQTIGVLAYHIMGSRKTSKIKRTAEIGKDRFINLRFDTMYCNVARLTHFEHSLTILSFLKRTSIGCPLSDWTKAPNRCARSNFLKFFPKPLCSPTLHFAWNCWLQP